MTLAWAEIENGVVVNVHRAASWPTGMDVSHLDPRPGPGWLHLGGDDFAPPPAPEPPAEPVPAMTRLQFLRRFTIAERISLRASTDPIVADAMHLLEMAGEGLFDDADAVAFLGYAVQNGYLPPERARDILTP